MKSSSYKETLEFSFSRHFRGNPPIHGSIFDVSLTEPRSLYFLAVKRGTKRYFYADTKRDGKLRYIPLGQDQKAAYQKFEALKAGVETVPEGARWVRQARDDLMRRRLNVAAEDARVRAKNRAKARGLDFSLTQEEVAALLGRQARRCAVTGLEFDVTPRRGTKAHRDPFRPSIDRIDSAKGYVAGNCRIVCFAVNIALADWGDEVFLKIAEAAVEYQRSREAA